MRALIVAKRHSSQNMEDMEDINDMNDGPLLPEMIRKNLMTAIFGRKEIIHFVTTDSTNDRAEALAEEGAPEGTLLIAESQTGGKGRMGRIWHSPPGTGIYLSIILRPLITPSEAVKITIMTAVAAAESIKKIYDVPLMIKWPNDILINKKKTVGILTSMNCTKNFVNSVIVGIGINVNTEKTSFPDEINEIATSLFAETGRKTGRVELLQKFLESFEFYYDLLVNGDFKTISERWKLLSNLINRIVELDLVNSSCSGKIIDIDKDGFLLIEDKRGSINKIISGDILRIL